MKLINTAHAGVISDAPTVSQVLINVLQFLLSVFGVIAIIGLVIAGTMYLTAGGNQRRLYLAKKAFMYSVVGIVIALGGYILIKTISSLLS